MVMSVIAKFAVIRCGCDGGLGQHLVGLSSDIEKGAVCICDDCGRPLMVRGEDGRFYYVGEQVK